MADIDQIELKAFWELLSTTNYSHVSSKSIFAQEIKDKTPENFGSAFPKDPSTSGKYILLHPDYNQMHWFFAVLQYIKTAREGNKWAFRQSSWQAAFPEEEPRYDV